MEDTQWTFSHWFLFEPSPDGAEATVDGAVAADEAHDPADED